MSQIRQSDRAFGLMFAAVFGIIFLVAWFVFTTWLLWTLVLAGAFLAAALVVPGLLLPLNRMWTGFAMRLGHINNYLILGLFFFFVVLPMGKIARLFGHDPMARIPAPDAKTYWTPVERHSNVDTFSDMF